MPGSVNILEDYLSQLQSALNLVPRKKMEELANILFESRSEATVFIAGNGGSAATASHFATDLGVGSLRRANPIRAISLSDNQAAITATSNDYGYSKIFAEQIELLGRPGDLLITISASGNSTNLIEATKCAKLLGLGTVAITGFDSGELGVISNLNIHVPTRIGSYGVAEDVHMTICHMVTELLRTKIG